MPGPFSPELPDPGSARDVDELIIRLRLLKVFAGDSSYDVIGRRMQVASCPERIPRSTVAACFTVGRGSPDEDLVLAIVALGDTETGIPKAVTVEARLRGRRGLAIWFESG